MFDVPEGGEPFRGAWEEGVASLVVLRAALPSPVLTRVVHATRGYGVWY